MTSQYFTAAAFLPLLAKGKDLFKGYASQARTVASLILATLTPCFLDHQRYFDLGCNEEGMYRYRSTAKPIADDTTLHRLPADNTLTQRPRRLCSRCEWLAFSPFSSFVG